MAMNYDIRKQKNYSNSMKYNLIKILLILSIKILMNIFTVFILNT